MLKDKLKIILREFHQTSIPNLVPRRQKIDYDILDSPVNKIFTIIGPRRAGKTCFLFQVIGRLLESGAQKEDVVYINFEDERIMPLQSQDFQVILDAYFELYGSHKKPFIFFDEVQNVDGWQRFVRRLNDQGFPVFVTGSNSRMLSRDIASELRGRTLTYEIFPFSFSEIIRAKGMVFEESMIYGNSRHQLIRLYEDYLKTGGYPEMAFIDSDRTRGLVFQDYFNTIFYRDMVERYQIKNTDLLRQWLNTLMSNISSLISFNKVENDFKSRGMKLSRATLSTFAGYIEDIYFGFFVEIFASSVRKRQINPRKFYLIDPGIHNYLTLKHSENRGRLLENIVFLHLKRQGLSVNYYKTANGHEIDFLIPGTDKPEIIQVCCDLSHIDIYHREKRALTEGMKELNQPRGLLLTWDEKREETVKQGKIEVMPVWEWLVRVESGG